MKNATMQNFERCVLVSGLISLPAWDELWADYLASRNILRSMEGEVFPETFSHYIVERGVLNDWQIQQLLAGHTKFNLGSYQIVNSLGQGGMGQVFLARHSVTKQEAAVKVLPRDKCAPEAIKNFQHEIRVLSSLHHPNIVGALDAGEDGGVCYLVCEYVPGQNLRKLIRNGRPLTMKSAASILSQAAMALQHTHEQGFVHRDIKPGNILVTPHGVAKLTDFGLATQIGGKNDPRAGKIVGTADYLSPDQVKCPTNPVPLWDIYSFGCSLYYIVTGKVPFPGGTTMEKARAHIDLLPLDPRLLNPTLSEDFVNVIADMMAKDPDKRIPSAYAVMERLAKWSPPTPCDIEMVDGAELMAAQMRKRPTTTQVSINTIMQAGANAAPVILGKADEKDKLDFDFTAKKKEPVNNKDTVGAISRHPAFSESEDLMSVQMSRQIEENERRVKTNDYLMPTVTLFGIVPAVLMFLTWLFYSLIT